MSLRRILVATDRSETAERRMMPDAAIAGSVADAVLPLEQIAPFLYGLCCK